MIGFKEEKKRVLQGYRKTTHKLAFTWFLRTNLMETTQKQAEIAY